MIQFAAVWWNPADINAEHRARTLEANLHAGQANVRIVIRKPGWLIATWGKDIARRAIMLPDKRGVILGKIFGKSGTNGPASLTDRQIATPYDFYNISEKLCHQYWGAYTLLWADMPHEAVFVFRDPIGTLDCVSWEADGLRIITSHALLCLRLQQTSSIGIDWRRMLGALSYPASLADDMPIAGISTVAPGSAVMFGRNICTERNLWNAASIAENTSQAAEPAARVRSVVQDCIATWRAEYGGVACEISGGLDSSIVAALLAKSGSVQAGYNYFTSDLVGDERFFARAIAQRIGVPLVETLLPVKGLTIEDLADLPVGNRPSIGAVSLFHDRDLADRSMAAGARTLFTGQGGDAVFFQHAAIELAADCSGNWRQQARQFTALSQWTGASIWTVLARRFGIGMRRRSHAFATPPRFFSREPAIKIVPPAWAGNLQRLSATKRIHVEALVQARLASGASWTSEAMTVVHPLLSQPIVETVLALPVMTLTDGFRDRGLARRAFSSDLPASVVDRYGKGALTPYFGQCLARSLPFLRAFLLEGVLAEHHVIARDLLETALDEEYLMQHDIYPELIWLVLTEHWARGWRAALDATGGSTARFG